MGDRTQLILDMADEIIAQCRERDNYRVALEVIAGIHPQAGVVDQVDDIRSYARKVLEGSDMWATPQGSRAKHVYTVGDAQHLCSTCGLGPEYHKTQVGDLTK